MNGRRSAFVKLSGDLQESPEILEWLKELTKSYYLVICTGGGKQINEEFEKQGFEIKFGPLGRETKSFKERQVARDVLERNRDAIQDLLDRHGIIAHVIIPVLDIGSVLCHVNGDIFVLAAYLGFDKVFVVTTEGRLVKKELFYEDVGTILARDVGKVPDGKLENIKLIGFRD